MLLTIATAIIFWGVGYKTGRLFSDGHQVKSGETSQAKSAVRQSAPAGRVPYSTRSDRTVGRGR